MTEPKPNPQVIVTALIPLVPLDRLNRQGDAAEAWLARTDALLAAYERCAPTPDPDSPIVTLGFIVMAADYLWQELRADADFEVLDAHEFTAYCRELVGAADTQQTFLDTMVAFYEFLAQHEGSTRATRIAGAFRELAAQ